MMNDRRVFYCLLIILIALACLPFAGCGAASQSLGKSGSLSLSGTSDSTPLPAVTITPTTFTFSNQALSSTSSPVTITLTNTGDASLSLTSVTVTGDFAQTNNCGTSLIAGTSCTVNATFTPMALGNRTGTLSLVGNAPQGPQTVLLSGTGVNAGTSPGAAVPVVSLSRTSLTFASQTMATTSTAQAVTLTNTGNASLSISGIGASGSFAETNNCGSSLASSASCTISVTFTPTATGTLTGGITLTDNAAASPQAVSLSGTAVAAAAPVVSLSATSLTFPSQTIATTSAAQAVTLTNTGNAALSISGIVASGSFAETNNCGSSLAASASCTVSITFTPTATGTLTGAISFTDNGTASPQKVSLSGTAIAATAPVVSLSPTSLTFASQTIATTSAAQVVTLTNTGNASLSISGIVASGTLPRRTTAAQAWLPAQAVPSRSPSLPLQRER